MGITAELGRLAIAAWSPGGASGGYIAAASYAGAVDTSFNATASLEVLSFDIQRSKLSVVSCVPVSDKFTAVDWSIPSRSHPAGLIAGGLTNGTVRIWDAATLLRPSKTTDENRGVVFGGPTSAKKHTAPVRSIAFNPFSPTRLASAAADGTVLVWDLTNPTTGPVVRHPGGQPSQSIDAPKEEMTAVAWNRKVQHILGSATSSGVMNVWDLKQSKQVISIRNPRGRLRCSSLSWHPDVATQIVISCDEDDSTAALLWDLRNATAPIMSYTHHTPKGIVASSWCTQDSDLLLTSSRDSRTIVVSVSSGDIVAEAPPSANWNFDVRWSPRIPGVYLSSSFDGRLTVNSMMTAATSPSVSSETANALAESFGEIAGGFQSGMADQSPRATKTQGVSYNLTRPPKWLKRPMAVSFAFGGCMASITQKEKGKVVINSFADSIPALTDNSAGLDGMLTDLIADDPSPAMKWCEEASASAETPREKMAWDALCIMFQTDCRRKLLAYLDFELPPLEAGDDISMPVYGLLQSQPLAVPVRPAPSSEAEIPQGKTESPRDLNSITNGTNNMNLEGPAPWEVLDTSGDLANMNDSLLDGDDIANGGDASLTEKPNGLSDNNNKNEGKKSLSGLSRTEVESIIKKAVIVGDFNTAVHACLHIEKNADALIIAHAGGPELWQNTQAEYLAKASLSVNSSILAAVAGPKSKMDDYIRQTTESSGETWKEALATLITYCPAEDLPEACTSLGQRCLLKKDYGPALFCFICGNNTRMATTAWTRDGPNVVKSRPAMRADRIEKLTNLVQKVRLLTAASLLARGEREIGTVKALDETSGSVLCEFGALLALQGNYSLAITYLSNLEPGYTCMYGSAEDLQGRATECLAMVDSNAVIPTQAPGVAARQAYDTYGNTYQESSYGYHNTPSYSNPNSYSTPPVPPRQADTSGYGNMPPPPPASNWNNPQPAPVPPAPAPYNAQSGVQQFPTARSPMLPAPPATPPRPNAFSSQSTTAERTAYDPSSAYAAAPAFTQNTYQAPPVPPVPSVNVSSVPIPSGQFSGGPIVAPPVPSMPVTPGAVPAPLNTLGYGVPAEGLGGMGGGVGMGSEAVAPPPPPPPPTDGNVPPPMPYHSKARTGSGAMLPPSAEVAVAEGRRNKPLSSSGTPGGLPKRSTSTSSSLSALGIETVLLEKADVGKIPANQQVIVKALRGSYMYARSLSEAPRYRKKMDDVSKRLGRLLAGLNNGLIAEPVVELLITFATYVTQANYDQASVVVSQLTKQYWDSSSQWIQGLKRLIDCVLTGR